ncbi:hypothetical protein B6U93_00680 [Candidatus Woesearchaeota archaeon ex4484_78]|nr:MAG: hypothetical protein B6U93_00680 [Candidatus Woesearchaeota archaeon ex4484_78]
MDKEKIIKALAEAKKLEKMPEPSKEEIKKIYRNRMKQAQKLRQLLKPTWFVLETRRQKKKSL